MLSKDGFGAVDVEEISPGIFEARLHKQLFNWFADATIVGQGPTPQDAAEELAANYAEAYRTLKTYVMDFARDIEGLDESHSV